MINELKIEQRWFVGKKDHHENHLYCGNLEIELFVIPSTHGYKTIQDIPAELMQEGDVIYKAFQFEWNGKPVIVKTPEGIHEQGEETMLSFPSVEEAEKFKQKMLDSFSDDDYWDDESERSALRELDYEIEDGESFAEISINEGRRWNKFLGKWYNREYDGVGYEVKVGDKHYSF